MGSENWSRALMQVGEGLGGMATYHAQKERDQANHLREISLQNLRGKQAKELDDARGERMKELADTRYERDIELEGIRAENRKQERTEATDYQNARIAEQELRRVEAGYMGQMDAIDAEISKASSMLQKARVEGGVMDENAAAQVEAEINALRQQKRMTHLRGIAMMQKLGDKRYADMDEYDLMREANYSAEEIKARKQHFAKQPKGDISRVDEAPAGYEGFYDRSATGGGTPEPARQLDSGEDSAEDSGASRELLEEAPQGEGSDAAYIAAMEAKRGQRAPVNEFLDLDPDWLRGVFDLSTMPRPKDDPYKVMGGVSPPAPSETVARRPR